MTWPIFESVGNVVGGLVGGVGGGVVKAVQSPETAAGAMVGATIAGTAGLVTTAGVVDPIAVPVGAGIGAIAGGSKGFVEGFGPGATAGWDTGGDAGKWLDDKIAQMIGADEGAEAVPASGAMADVCSTCPPPPDSECGRLYAKIQETTQELAKRRADMLADRPVSQGGLGMYELFLRDPVARVADPRGIKPDLGNWQGHHDQILEKQRNIKSNLKQYNKKKCGVLPNGAETQSDLPPPSRPFT